MPTALQRATSANLAKRREQLRRAKRDQRGRQRDAGLALCQLAVPRRIGELLREAAKHADVLHRLEPWLELEVVDITNWPQLQLLCWNRHERWIAGAEALALYERNWRFITPAELSPEEALFIERLAQRHGSGVLHV